MSFTSSPPDAAAAVVSPGATDGSLYASFDETAGKSHRAEIQAVDHRAEIEAVDYRATETSAVGELSVSIRKRVQRTTTKIFNDTLQFSFLICFKAKSPNCFRRNNGKPESTFLISYLSLL
jgi:hypothetical protein